MLGFFVAPPVSLRLSRFSLALALSAVLSMAGCNKTYTLCDVVNARVDVGTPLRGLRRRPVHGRRCGGSVGL